MREKFADEVLGLTDNRGVDLIFDAVGKPTLGQSIRCLAPFGHVILYGRAGGAPDPLSLVTLFPKLLKVRAFSLPTVSGRSRTSFATAPTAAFSSGAPAGAGSTSAGPFRCPRHPMRTATSNRDSRPAS
jgi:NADPH:quinone reductase-like Zn-dependent oxidoreductase